MRTDKLIDLPPRRRSVPAEAACIDPSLVARAGKLLKVLRLRQLTIVTAESCTAGLIAAALSQADGAGEILHGSFVTYTKANKSTALGVSPELLRTEGSVNAAVVKELACGALARSPADLALAVSGVLGPDPDEDGNPVGLVYLCCCRRDGQPTIVRENYGTAPHDLLRRRVVIDALDLAEACISKP